MAPQAARRMGLLGAIGVVSGLLASAVSAAGTAPPACDQMTCPDGYALKPGAERITCTGEGCGASCDDYVETQPNKPGYCTDYQCVPAPRQPPGNSLGTVWASAMY